MKQPSVIAALLLSSLCGIGRGALPPVLLEPVIVDAFDALVGFTHAGDGSGRNFLVEQRGRILILKNKSVRPTPFLDIESKLIAESDIPNFGPPFGMYDERGLLGLAFHPDYASDGTPGEGKFYVYYSAPSQVAGSNSKSIIAEYGVSAADPNLADPNSERILLEVEQPQFNHNGGQIAFGTEDRFLYIGIGDGGSSNDNNVGHTGGNANQPDGVLGNAQDKTQLLGKILRIDVLGTNGPGGHYGIPASNPFVGNASGHREEIFAVGVRNPWRFSFDRGGSSQRLFCADVGQGLVEEIDLIVSGGNYGWRIKEGNLDFDATAPNPDGDSMLPPIAEYAHGGKNVDGLMSIGDSVTGGYVYRGLCNPDLRGIYLFADWGTFGDIGQSGTLLALTEAGGTFQLERMTVIGGNPIGEYIYALGEDEDGEVYVLTKKSFNPVPGVPDGSIFRIREAGSGLAVELEPEIDNTMYSESARSNGAGGWIFAGRTGFSASTGIRRALLQFDVASALTPAAVIESAALTLVADRTQQPSSLTSLHRVLAEWGEGGSNAGAPGGAGIAAQAGDATWMHRIFDTENWAANGGDFVAAASSSQIVTGEGNYTWDAPGMVADVQHWLESDENFGWILIGDEQVTKTAKRFVSKDGAVAADHPKLTLRYAGVIHLDNRDKWLRRFFAEGVDIADVSDDDRDDLDALVEYGFGTNPLVPNDAGTVVGLEGIGDQFTLSFRRDIAADDLIYRLRVSSDLINWTTVVEIVGTAAPTGTGFLSEENIPGTAKYKLVTGRDPENVSVQTRRFLHVEVERIQP
ncbi:MAG: PQQ-dependent sugar dehydrogenase [Verrucomicrobiales bacterium]